MDFLIFKIDNIHFGSYPLESADINQLKKKNVHVLMNLMTNEQKLTRGIDVIKQNQLLKNHGILQINNSIDEKASNYEKQLFNGALVIDETINMKKMNIYVYCSSGLTRSPTLILAYLCLFKKIDTWESVPKTIEYMKTHMSMACPNGKHVEKLI